MGRYALWARGASRLAMRRRFGSNRFWVVSSGAVACVLAAATLARAQPAAPASTSRNIRQDAVHSLPLDKIDEAARAKVTRVVNETDIFRRLPAQVIDCNPDLFLFLIRNPEVIVNIWELMGVSKVTMQRNGATSFDASDHAGSRCTIEFLYSDHDTHLVYAEGTYDGPLFAKSLRAKCVMLLKNASLRETDGHDYITCRMDTFIHIENVGVDILAKTFQPLVTKSADYNFRETVAFVSLMSRTAERNPQGVARLAGRLKSTDPEIRNQFAVLAQGAADHAARRQAQHSASQTARPASTVQKR